MPPVAVSAIVRVIITPNTSADLASCASKFAARVVRLGRTATVEFPPGPTVEPRERPRFEVPVSRLTPLEPGDVLPSLALVVPQQIDAGAKQAQQIRACGARRSSRQSAAGPKALLAERRAA